MKSVVNAESTEFYNRCATERKRSFWNVLLSQYKDMKHLIDKSGCEKIPQSWVHVVLLEIGH